MEQLKYLLVEWPESQSYSEEEWFEQEAIGTEDGAYFIPVHRLPVFDFKLIIDDGTCTAHYYYSSNKDNIFLNNAYYKAVETIGVDLFEWVARPNGFAAPEEDIIQMQKYINFTLLFTGGSDTLHGKRIRYVVHSDYAKLLIKFIKYSEPNVIITEQKETPTLFELEKETEFFAI